MVSISSSPSDARYFSQIIFIWTERGDIMENVSWLFFITGMFSSSYAPRLTHGHGRGRTTKRVQAKSQNIRSNILWGVWTGARSRNSPRYDKIKSKTTPGQIFRKFASINCKQFPSGSLNFYVCNLERAKARVYIVSTTLWLFAISDKVSRLLYE